MAGKEPSVQILTRSRLLSATADLAPRGGEPRVQADSLCVHTCTLVPTRISIRGPRGPYVTKRQDTPVQFPGVSHANTDGPTGGMGNYTLAHRDTERSELARHTYTTVHARSRGTIAPSDLPPLGPFLALERHATVSPVPSNLHNPPTTFVLWGTQRG